MIAVPQNRENGYSDSMIRRFLPYYKPHKTLFILDMAAAVVMAVISIAFPYITRGLLKDHIPSRDLAMIVNSLLVMTGVYLLIFVCNYVRIKWGHIMGVRMEADMRQDLFRHVQKLSFTYFDNTKTGHIMSRISNDLNLISEVAHHAPEDLLISVVVILGAYTFMFMFSLPLALISLIPFPFMVLWGILFGGRMRQGFRRVRREVADINSTVENSVQGIREVKAFANERVEEEKFSVSNRNFQIAKEDAFDVMARFHAVINFLRDFYYLVVVGGGVLLIYRGVVEVYDLLSFILYISVILPPIDRLINFNEQLQQGTAAFERFTEIMDIEPDISDAPGAVSLTMDHDEVRFDDVWFRYERVPDWTLRGVTLVVPYGKRIAIVGESGAGKSTLVSLLPRFYEVQKGRVSIGAHDIMQVTQRSLRETVGIVQQNVFLFDATIRENIAYGKAGATDEDIERAARMANIHDFIMELPDEYDTEVGERGVKLSGGQKQRVAIARVFLKDPPVLVFDEATSSLDNESESLIQEAMFRLSENRTTIIIAHRLSTVRHVDTIYVMRSGEIVEEGTHEALLAQNGYYAQLYARGGF